jgi:hypothetical protein
MWKKLTVLIAAMGYLHPLIPVCAQSDLCNCGPDTCLKDPRYLPKLSAKKARLKSAPDGFPDDLIALLDRDGHCVMAIDQAPDAFRILLDNADGSLNSVNWTSTDENIARNDLRSGSLKAYYKFNVRKVFSCCGEPKAEDRGDWDSRLSLSRNLAIQCKVDNGKIACK